jgi:hypothetical protein
MKKMGDLMKDMGFNPNSSTSAQEAFIKHLIKAAHGVDVMTPSEKKIIQDNPQKIVSLKSLANQQMAFDFESAVEFETESNKKTGS